MLLVDPLGLKCSFFQKIANSFLTVENVGPYGQQAQGTPQAGPGYTGHVNDPDTGLVYMQQRYYDPVVGRFLSPDLITPTPGNLFNFGRYTYANDSPLRYIDPAGMCGEVSNSVQKMRNASDSNAGATPNCQPSTFAQIFKSAKSFVASFRGALGRYYATLPSLKILGAYPQGYRTAGRIWRYQLLDPSGKPLDITGKHLIQERLELSWIGVHEGVHLNDCQHRWCPVTHGIIYDVVGPNQSPDPRNHYTLTVIQTFLLKYHGNDIQLPNIFKHVIRVKDGYVIQASSIDVTPDWVSR